VGIGSDIDGPYLNAVTLEAWQPLGARKFRRHEEDVSVLLGPRGHLDQVECELAVVRRVHGSKGLRANHAVDLAHDVERLRRMRTRRQVIAAGVRMQPQQLAGCGERHGIGPGLVDLLDHVQSVTFDRMKPDAVEFHAAEEVDGIAGLHCDPGVRVRGGLADLAEVAIDIFNGPDQHDSPYPETQFISPMIKDIIMGDIGCTGGGGVANAGGQAVRRFLEFFAANIRNKNTRTAYLHAVGRFLAWCEHHQIGGLADIEPLHVVAYIEALGTNFEKPTVKPHLAAIRMLFDWLVAGQIVAPNPAHAVRGPKHVVKVGKIMVLDAEQAQRLLDSIDISTVVGLRDRALISALTFAFARIGAVAVAAMRVENYYPIGKRWWVRLYEKGGKRHEMSAHHNLEAYLDSYIEAAGIRDGGKAPCSAPR